MTWITRRGVVAGAAATFLAPRHARAAEFMYKYANNLPATHPMNTAAQRMIERIKEESKGRLEIEIFPNNQLGGDTDMLSQLRSGAIEFFTLSGLILATLVPAASINGIGFAFKDYTQVWAAMDGELGAYVRAQIAKAGLVAMDKMWDNGYRQVTSSTKPITAAEDLAGFKIRVPVSPLWTSMFKAFGAAPVAINGSELYSALQAHVVDGQENPLVAILVTRLYEVQKYCALTHHMWDGFWFAANARAWGRLPAELQEIAARHINQAAVEEREDVRKLNESCRMQLQASGMVFNTPDPQPFRAKLKAAGFYSEWRQKVGPKAWSLLERYAGELA